MRFSSYILTGQENLAFTSGTYFRRKWSERKKTKRSCGSEVNDCSNCDNYEVMQKFSQNNISMERTNAWLFQWRLL